MRDDHAADTTGRIDTGDRMVLALLFLVVLILLRYAFYLTGFGVFA